MFAQPGPGRPPPLAIRQRRCRRRCRGRVQRRPRGRRDQQFPRGSWDRCRAGARGLSEASLTLPRLRGRIRQGTRTYAGEASAPTAGNTNGSETHITRSSGLASDARLRHVEESISVIVARAGHLASRLVAHARNEQMIFEMATDVRQIDGNGDAERSKVVSRADARQHQEARELMAPAQSKTSMSGRTTRLEIRSPIHRWFSMTRPSTSVPTSRSTVAPSRLAR